jgi:hypothetical protein
MKSPGGGSCGTLVIGARKLVSKKNINNVNILPTTNIFITIKPPKIILKSVS